MTTTDMYQILELEEGADPAAVKKAYFRLVRKYTPEKNPEEFQKLRQAYETLKDGVPDRESKNWVTWKTPMVGYLLEAANGYEEAEDHENAARIMQDAITIEPDNPLLYLLAARYMMYAEHPQKAAKYAEFVTRALPDNREGWMIYANGLHNRGWYKKALPAFRRAYALGIRNNDFMVGYGINLRENGLNEEAISILRGAIDNTACTEENENLLLEAYHQLALAITADEKTIAGFLHEYDRFALQYGTKMAFIEILNPMIEMTRGRQDVITSKANRARIIRSVRTYQQKKLIPEDVAQFTIWDMIHCAMMLEQRPLLPYWAELCNHTVNANDPGLRRYARTDCQLCLMMKRAQASGEAEIIRKDYPELAEEFPELMDALGEENPEQYIKKLEWEFEKLSERYTGAHYDKLTGLAPAEKKKKKKNPEPLFIGDEEDLFPEEQPFVRETDKVGRNDPCPCGSGKKFKKCCMGKGVYD